MNLIKQLKHKSAPATTAGQTDQPLGDLVPLAQLVQSVRRRTVEHRKTLEALGAARSQLREMKEAPPPDISLAVAREMIVALGDSDRLVQFDADNAEAIRTEAQAQEQAQRDRDILPARLVALEKLIQQSAVQMMERTPITEIEREAELIFTPYADQLVAAAKLYVEALRQAYTVAHKIERAVTIREINAFGEMRHKHKPELIDRLGQGEIVPTRLVGYGYQDLSDLNYRASRFDEELLARVERQLFDAGVKGSDMEIFRPKLDDDPRKVYAPEAAPRAKRPEVVPYGQAAVVTIQH